MKTYTCRGAAALACLLLLVLLAGCAAGSTSTGTSPTATPTPAAPTETATPAPGSAALNGCPSQQPPATAGASADVLAPAGAGGPPAQPVSVKKGQTLEVRLPATIRWKLTVQGDQTILTADNPNGWYDVGSKQCIWRFTAVAQGQVTLAYSGGLVCQPYTACPTLAMAQNYAVTVG